MAPYPTSHEIEDIIKWRESPDTMSKFDEKLAKNLDARVMGYDHHLSGTHKGADAWREDLRARMAGMLDTSKPISLDVNAIGGGDTPWACVEMKTTGKAKSGELFTPNFRVILTADWAIHREEVGSRDCDGVALQSRWTDHDDESVHGFCSYE